MSRVLNQLMSIIAYKVRYSWSESGLNLKLIAEIDGYSDTGESIRTTAPDQQVVEDIAEWCLSNSCGHRISYDTFKFNNRKQITLFLLRWGEVKDE